ncbi:hypothetical protein [Shigella phage ESh19]|nr:hypothetical protein [Shigella phage ESh19]
MLPLHQHAVTCEGFEPSPFLYQRNRLFIVCCKRSSVKLLEPDQVLNFSN